MKSTKRIMAAVEGKLPYEELTDKELMKLQRLVFKAIATKKSAFQPHTTLQ